MRALESAESFMARMQVQAMENLELRIRNARNQAELLFILNVVWPNSGVPLTDESPLLPLLLARLDFFASDQEGTRGAANAEFQVSNCGRDFETLNPELRTLNLEAEKEAA